MVTRERSASSAGDAAARLDALLSESSAAARERERSAFDAFAGHLAKRIVLFGAGGLGRRMLRALRDAGIEPIAFCDNQSALWGTAIEGVPVLEPATAAQRFGTNATFVVTIWGALGKDRMRDRVAQLQRLGCTCVTPFLPLAWKYPRGVLPQYGADLPSKAIEASADIRSAFALWSDDASREEFVRQVAWRLLGDFDGLSAPGDGPIYFPRDVVRMGPAETFVDCGAYDGDTAKLFTTVAGSFGKIVAFEPDPANYAKLRASLLTLPGANERNAIAMPYATGARQERLRFSATGSASSAVGDGALEVESVALDDVLANDRPTYIKMDIEGSEPAALEGARASIVRDAPLLGISCYHRQDHLWSIPLQIAAMRAGYAYHLRPHDLEMWDLICYAVPPAMRPATVRA